MFSSDNSVTVSCDEMVMLLQGWIEGFCAGGSFSRRGGWGRGGGGCQMNLFGWF